MRCGTDEGTDKLALEKLQKGRTIDNPSDHTVQACIGALLESFVFYEIKRFGIKGNEILRTPGDKESDSIATNAYTKNTIK